MVRMSSDFWLPSGWMVDRAAERYESDISVSDSRLLGRVDSGCTSATLERKRERV